MIRISVGPHFHLRYLVDYACFLNTARNFSIKQNLSELLRN